MTSDFWYLIGHNYEVRVFKTKRQAQAILNMLDDDSDYYQLHSGRYGEEFSGWIGEARPHSSG